MEPKSIALLQKVDSNVEQILLKFQDIFNVSVNSDKSRDQLAVESLTIESDALTIIRLCEDLLYISRNLRESWCLGSMKVDRDGTAANEPDVDKVFQQFNNLTEIIGKFESNAL